ncbi:MAG: DUF3592 domain-containing protein [Planctomyces sp.]
MPSRNKTSTPEDSQPAPKQETGTARLFGYGCATFFLLPFALAGTAVLYLGVSQIREARVTSTWAETPAWIDRAELIINSGGEGTTYSTRAEYRYEWKQKEYHGNRVWLSERSDSGSFHSQIINELQSSQQAGRRFRCFVNPDNPSESILYRDLRYDLLLIYALFGVVFGGIGFGGLYGLFLAGRNARRMQQLAGLYPEEPWRWTIPASDGLFRSDNRWVVLVISAVVWNLFSWPLAVILLSQRGWQFGPVWLILLMPVAGTWLAWMAWRAVRLRLRYGVCLLQVTPWPYFAGDPLQATLTSPGMIPNSEQLTALLRVTQTVSGDDGDKELYRETVQVPVSRQEVSFVLHPPAHLPRTRRLIDHHSIRTAKWTLTLTGTDGPGDFDARFQIEVFGDAERSSVSDVSS